MQDGGLRSPRLPTEGAVSSSKRSRRVAKMLVRSGLRCYCCFKLKHECEHRKAAILHANYRTLSCRRLLSLSPLLSFFFCPGSTGPGPWWLHLEPPCSRHSISATPGIFSHGCTCMRCEAGTGKVVSTPGGSPVLPLASVSACRQPEHGRNQQASQVTQHDRSPPGQLEPHVCTHANNPSSELFRHGLAVSAPWIFATAPKLQNDCESSAWKSLHRQPLIILATAIRSYTMPGQVPPGRTTNVHSRGLVVSTPGLDPRVPCMQLSPSFRLVCSSDPPTLHAQNISSHREVFARYGTQQHNWFCHEVRMGYIITPAHIPGTLSHTFSANSTLWGPVRLFLAMVPSPSAKRKSSRRLPSYLRNQVGAAPVGEL